MENWEAELARVTAPGPGGILGAVGLVVNSEGKTLYHHVAGRQSLQADSPPLDANCTMSISAAGKFITNIAALQLVESGAINLDEPLKKYIHEIESLRIITPSNVEGELFTLRAQTKVMTLRHLLLYTSGMSSPDLPIIREYLASDVPKPKPDDDAHFLVNHFFFPLLDEPGEGFYYGTSIRATQLLVERLSGSFWKHIKERIFGPLGMASSTYGPRDMPDVWERRLQMVERNGDELVAADHETQGLTCSMSDIASLFCDLLSSASKLLRPEHIDLLFAPQLPAASSAMLALHQDPDNYCFVEDRAGPGEDPPHINWTMAGLLVEEEQFVRSGIPRGTITWEGHPNVLWAMNREKGVAAFFGTQLIPEWDKPVDGIRMSFMRNVWKAFG